MKRKHYTTEFKKEAARMLIIEGLDGKEVSEQLGVNRSQLYRWKRAYINQLEGSSSPGELIDTDNIQTRYRQRGQIAIFIQTKGSDCDIHNFVMRLN